MKRSWSKKHIFCTSPITGILENTKLQRGSLGTAGVRTQRGRTETWHRTSREVKLLTPMYLSKLTKMYCTARLNSIKTWTLGDKSIQVQQCMKVSLCWGMLKWGTAMTGLGTCVSYCYEYRTEQSENFIYTSVLPSCMNMHDVCAWYPWK